jgi:hypothetical protein
MVSKPEETFPEPLERKDFGVSEKAKRFEKLAERTAGLAPVESDQDFRGEKIDKFLRRGFQILRVPIREGILARGIRMARGHFDRGHTCKDPLSELVAPLTGDGDEKDRFLRLRRFSPGTHAPKTFACSFDTRLVLENARDKPLGHHVSGIRQAKHLRGNLSRGSPLGSLRQVLYDSVGTRTVRCW